MVSPWQFESQIQAILDAGYRVIPLATVARALRDGRSDTLRRSVVLTLDDGYRGQFTFAYPVLRRRRLPATFFLVAGNLGTYSVLPHLKTAPSSSAAPAGEGPAWLPLSWDEVDDLAGGGMNLGSHALTHRSLGHLASVDAAAEASISRWILEGGTDIPIELFAYPFGSRAYGDFNDDVQEALRSAGYLAACTTVVGRAGDDSDLFALPRIPMQESDGPFRTRCKLAGAYDWVGPLKSLYQRLMPRRERVDALLPDLPGFSGPLRMHERSGT